MTYTIKVGTGAPVPDIGRKVVDAIKQYENRNGNEWRGGKERAVLSRSFDFVSTRADDGDDLTLEGYAAVFNSPTEIDSWEGRFTEIIAPGAFAKTISERMPILQFDHGTHPLIGSLPLGTIRRLGEDDHGLHVQARLSDNWLVAPVRDAIRDGAITGMSFRFSIPKGKATWSQNRTVRTLHEVALAELGPVVWPAYKETSVGVRSDNLLRLLGDASIRDELARTLAFGTEDLAEVEADDTVTSTEAPDEPLVEALGGPSKHERLAAARPHLAKPFLDILEGVRK